MAPRCQPATLSQAEAVVYIDHRHSCARGFRLHRGTCHHKVGACVEVGADACASFIYLCLCRASTRALVALQSEIFHG